MGCSQPKPQTVFQKVVSTVTIDSTIATINVLSPQPIDALNFSNLIQLMESLDKIPFEQRQVTLKSIKEEANSLLTMKWPTLLEINPVRSRYMVFVTHAHIASDKRLGQNAAEEQAESIVKMKMSWNTFVGQMNELESSAVLETTFR
jgi:hypothetical protein